MGAGTARRRRGRGFVTGVKLAEFLGLDPTEGGTAVPLLILIPVVVLFSFLAALLLTSWEGESGLVQFAVVGAVFALVLPVSAGVARWTIRRRR